VEGKSTVSRDIVGKRLNVFLAIIAGVLVIKKC